MCWNVFSCLLSRIPYYCVITQYSLTKINSGDISGYSSIAFYSVLKPWRRYYTIITHCSTVHYCKHSTVFHCSEGLPLAHVASLVALEPCTVLYCTLLYSTLLYCNVLYCTLLLQGAPFSSSGTFGSSWTLYCTLVYATVLYCTLLDINFSFPEPSS